jgi:hypothetical protein
MEHYPEAVRQRDLRPVITLVGSPKTTDEFVLTLCSFNSAKQMDFELFQFSQDFDCRRDLTFVDPVRLTGILPRHWPTKRRRQVPAVLCLLFDWTAQDTSEPKAKGPEWHHKEEVILYEVKRYREQMKGRYTKLFVFAFLSEAQYAEGGQKYRVSQLRKLCELEAKGLHVVEGGPSALSSKLGK